MQLVRSDAFHLGQEFAKHYPCSVADMIAYQKLHDKSNPELFNGADLSGSHSHSVNKSIGGKTGQPTGAFSASDGKNSKGGFDVGSRGKTKAGNVTNVRHNSSQAKQHGANEKSKQTTSTTSDQRSNRIGSYLSFSEWKASFNGARSITSWMEYLRLPTKGKLRTKQDISEEALDFMKGVMDECTHLGNFCTPVDTSLIIIVAAKHDAYVPRDTSLNLQQLWPGCEVRYVDTGHIAAFLTKQHIFRSVYIVFVQGNSFQFSKDKSRYQITHM